MSIRKPISIAFIFLIGFLAGGLAYKEFSENRQWLNSRILIEKSRTSADSGDLITAIGYANRAVVLGRGDYVSCIFLTEMYERANQPRLALDTYKYCIENLDREANGNLRKTLLEKIQGIEVLKWTASEAGGAAQERGRPLASGSQVVEQNTRKHPR